MGGCNSDCDGRCHKAWRNEARHNKEWGDRSMLATIALGVAQSPWGVASGAITGHLFATSVAIIGGAFLATYISEKLVGFVSGVLFLVFSVATLFGAF